MRRPRNPRAAGARSPQSIKVAQSGSCCAGRHETPSWQGDRPRYRLVRWASTASLAPAGAAPTAGEVAGPSGEDFISGLAGIVAA